MFICFRDWLVGWLVRLLCVVCGCARLSGCVVGCVIARLLVRLCVCWFVCCVCLFACLIASLFACPFVGLVGCFLVLM